MGKDSLNGKALIANYQSLSLSIKRYWKSRISFSSVAWSGGGETPVGLARQSETLQAEKPKRL